MNRRGSIISVEWLRSLLLLLALAMCSSAHGQTGDFDPANPEWNGLSSLSAILAAAGTLETPGSSPVPTDQILWLVQPQSVDTDALYSWVSDGGQLMLADESGGADEFLDALGLSVEVDIGEHAELFQGDSRLPVLGANGVHALSRNAPRVVGNGVRPLRGVGRAVFELDEGGGLVWDVSLGDGRVVVVADPSMLINLMLPIEHNAALVTSIIQYLCPEGPCTHRLATATTPELAPGEPLTGLNLSLSRLGELVDALTDVDLDPRFVWFANVLLAAGVVFVFWTAFPRTGPASPPAMPSHWPLAIRSTLYNEISRYSGVLAETSFVRPAAQLAQSFKPLYDRGAVRWSLPLMTAAGEPDKARELALAWVRRMEGNHRGFALSRRVRELTWLFATLARSPQGPSLPVQTQVLSRDEFMKLYDLSREVLEKLEMHGEFDPPRSTR
jgi:hypothetical protein